MRRLFLLPLALLMTGASSPDPSPAETGKTIAGFAAAAGRSLSPRSGDLFALPAKHAYVIDHGMLIPTTSHLERDGREVSVSHEGNHHGTFWDYDTRIPLLLYGPSYVKAGLTSNAPATQQDLVPTLAGLIGAVPPEDAAGRNLSEALKPAGAAKPKAVLVLVFDQGGRSLLDAHPGATPFISSLRARGSWYEEARLTHLDPETIVGHVAIGTGAYPSRHGVTANKPWIAAAGTPRMAVAGENGPTPAAMESASLADAWLRQTGGAAKVVSQSLADRAAMGMAGHGALYQGNPKPVVQWYDDARGAWTTNIRAYRQPEALAAMRAEPYWKAFAPDGQWRGHRIDNPVDFRISPAVVKFDGDAMATAIVREGVGEDEVTDLVFWSIKACDYTSHRYGLESLETRDALAQADAQAKRIVTLLEERAGRGRFVMAFTADHGGGPLAELTGGRRMAESELLGRINRRFDKLDNRVALAQAATSTQIYLDDAELKANGTTPEAVRDFLKTLNVNGKPFFAAVFTRAEIAARARR